jgi:carbohydrate kinase (thermoresistant glucokinase family)
MMGIGQNAFFFIVMGVSGSGKSTVGKALASALNLPFYDGDSYHPPENIAKMAAGIPLTDTDRAGWLAALAELIDTEMQGGRGGVLACSALKQKYRDVLSSPDPEQVRFIYLKGTYEVILARMGTRGAHYMKPDMLKSQFDILEEPASAITVDVIWPVEEIVKQVLISLSPI